MFVDKLPVGTVECAYAHTLRQACDSYLNQATCWLSLSKTRFPSAEVPGTVGRVSSFEIKINGTLVYSKLGKGKWPNFDDVVAAVKEVADGKSPDQCQVDSQ